MSLNPMSQTPLPPVITNNTPLSALFGIGQLPILHALYGTVLIPSAVQSEFLAIHAKQRQRALANAVWLQAIQLTNPLLADAFAELDRGEAEVLALALERPPRLVIIDERRARAYAKRLKLPLTGTVGVLIQAKRQGHIPALQPLLTQLIANGFHLHSKLVKQALALVGEDTL